MKINNLFLIHIGASFGFVTAGDDLCAPSIWTTDIVKFKIGDIFGDLTNNIRARPAQIDASTIEINGKQYSTLGFALHMSGSIRFGKAEFGSIDFGPGAIDGFDVHRLNIYMIQ